VHSAAFGMRNIDTLFFMLKWDQYRFQWDQRLTLMFLHPVGCAGHVVYSDESGHETSTYYFDARVGQVKFL
jgi:hypothetical protein